MNNALATKPKVIEATTVDDAISQAVSGTDKVHLATVAGHLRNLRESVHFKKYIEYCIHPLVQKKIKLLRKSKDDTQYLQGFLDGLDEMCDIEAFEKNYRLKIEKNAKGK